MKAALAEAVARQGDLDGGLRLLEECLEQIARPGWNERVWLPEVLRLKGWMLAQQGQLCRVRYQPREAADQGVARRLVARDQDFLHESEHFQIGKR